MLDITKYYDRTDNKYFPNDPETWKEFMWKLHFMGGRCVIYAMHLDAKEKAWHKRREEHENSSSNNR